VQTDARTKTVCLASATRRKRTFWTSKMRRAAGDALKVVFNPARSNKVFGIPRPSLLHRAPCGSDGRNNVTTWGVATICVIDTTTGPYAPQFSSLFYVSHLVFHLYFPSICFPTENVPPLAHTYPSQPWRRKLPNRHQRRRRRSWPVRRARRAFNMPCKARQRIRSQIRVRDNIGIETWCIVGSR
jgi:hypothetical protein